MMKNEIKLRPMPRRPIHSPFDDSAVERQRRMGLLREDGTPDREVVAVLCRVFAGQYFDDLCDYCQDMDAVRERLSLFLEIVEKSGDRQNFLFVCMLYDDIYRPMPDPAWWLSGNEEMVTLFTAGFAARIRELLEGVR